LDYKQREQILKKLALFHIMLYFALNCALNYRSFLKKTMD